MEIRSTFLYMFLLSRAPSLIDLLAMDDDETLEAARSSGALRHAWIKPLPSGLVTNGCNFGVVNVYTKPVSETTNNNTWVPVNVLNS